MTRTFVSKKLNLPLFLVSRNRIKTYSLPKLKKYIVKQRNLYIKKCLQSDDDAIETKEKKPKNATCADILECPVRPLNISRDICSPSPWALPPNRYLLPSELFTKQKGYLGAFWPKAPRFPEPSKLHKSPPAFYEFSTGQNMFPNCNRHKYFLRPDIRERRPTSRLMLIDINSCWRDPKFPGPATYNLEEYMRPCYETKVEPPYRFLRNSCVPAKDMSIHPPNRSFEPGPGRYEIYQNVGFPCSRRKKYLSNVYLEIEKQKRLKFRRQQFKKMRLSEYCTPAWRHVQGQGHTSRFRKHSDDADKLDENKKHDNIGTVLYPDAKYIYMINVPKRQMMSMRKEKLRRTFNIVYNTMAKRSLRKVTAVNKKVVFGSGQERWPDNDRVLQPGKKTADKIVNQPIMRLSVSEIKSKLDFVPERLQCRTGVNRKEPFKFSSIPAAELLVRDSMGKVDSITASGAPLKMYGKTITYEDYFK